MVAGFIAKYIETKDYKVALDYSVLCGSASVFSKELATNKEIEALINNN